MIISESLKKTKEDFLLISSFPPFVKIVLRKTLRDEKNELASDN